MPTSTPGPRAALAALVLAVSLAIPLGAEEAYVVRDIAPGPGPQLGSDTLVVPAGDRVFVLAADDDHGHELWTTDGTAAGTRLVRDICPGRCSSHPQHLGSLGDRLLFSASTGVGGHTLWISDGSWEGTRPLGSGALRLAESASVGFLEDRGLFFFAARRGAEIGLWVTDGTRAGTRPVGIGGPDGWPLDPQGFSTARGRLFFAASSVQAGRIAPWVTDGTEQGTRRLVDFDPDPAHRFVDLGFHRLPAGTVFFVRSAFGEPCETTLWRSDGTPAGTVLVRVFDDPDCQGDAVASPALAAGGALYFNARDGAQPRQLWRSDGTAAGTRPLTAFDGVAFESTFEMVASGDAVLFPADDGVTGFEPWIADAAGARRLVDLCPGTCSSRPEELARVAGRFYFQADDGTHGDELFRSDGTAAGTRLVHDACPGDCDSRPTVEGVAGGRVYFTTALLEQGPELWAAPAGGDGAVRVTDLAPDRPFSTSTSLFSGAALGDRFVFAADDGEHGRELWQSDGTPAGTGLVADVRSRRELGAGSYPVRVTPWDDGVLFFADEPDFGYQPWFSDGTEAGTRRLGQVVFPDRAHFQTPYSEPVILGAHALFLADGDSGLLELWRTTPSGPPVKLLTLPNTETNGLPSLRESTRLGDRAVFMLQRGFDSDGGVWVSDGTAAGSVRLGQITISNFGSGDFSGELGGRLYFNAAGPGSEDFELWRTDGTAAGTVRVADVAPGPAASGPHSFARLGGRLLFAATTEAEGRELWATDGTAAGTRLVADLVPGPLGSFPHGLTAVGDRVLFFVPSGPAAVEVWSSDGTAAGTAPLARFSGDAVPVRDAPNRAVAGGRLFFTFINFSGGPADLWVSDGTVTGTGSLRPLLPPSGYVHGVWSAGDRVRVSLWFFGPTGEVNELWETDGTLAGTRRLVSLSSLGLVQPIAQLAEAGSLLYFQGPHPEAGAELMALPLGPSAPCAADAETLCLRDGRFAVRVRWRDPRTGNQGVGGALPLAGSDHSGLFWFFDDDNVELVVKTLDGGGVNGWFWNFYGALSDVEYWIEVRDTATGRRVEYHNPEGEICGRGDTSAFRSREPVPLPVPPAPVPAPAVDSAPAPGGSACGGGPGDLCLHGGRFRVEVTWRNHRNGAVGAGTAVPGTDRSGFFWFFDDENVELVVKVLDGRTVNGRFWVFYGALSDVEYTITVTDTETQDTAVYTNPPGEICGRGDTAAF